MLGLRASGGQDTLVQEPEGGPAGAGEDRAENDEVAVHTENHAHQRGGPWRIQLRRGEQIRTDSEVA